MLAKVKNAHGRIGIFLIDVPALTVYKNIGKISDIGNVKISDIG